jgi:transcriptional regulator with XRE-family HTH domain
METLQHFSRKIMTEQTFGQWIKSIRESKRMSKTECAKRAGVSTSRWWQIETDESRRKDEEPPRIERETVAWVAVGLDVPLNEALKIAGYAVNQSTADAARHATALSPRRTVIDTTYGEGTVVFSDGQQTSMTPQVSDDFLSTIREMFRAEVRAEMEPLIEEVQELRKELEQKEKEKDGQRP